MGALKCPKCKGKSVSVQMVEVGSKTKKTGNGLFGNVHNAARGVAAIATLGVSNILIPKAKGKEKSKNKLTKYAICQDCGYSWEV